MEAVHATVRISACQRLGRPCSSCFLLLFFLYLRCFVSVFFVSFKFVSFKFVSVSGFFCYFFALGFAPCSGQFEQNPSTGQWRWNWKESAWKPVEGKGKGSGRRADDEEELDSETPPATPPAVIVESESRRGGHLSMEEACKWAGELKAQASEPVKVPVPKRPEAPASDEKGDLKRVTK